LPAVIDMRVRPRVQGFLKPFGQMLARLGLGPTFVTLFGVSVTILGAVMIGVGLLVSGSLVALLGSAIDGLDGAVARASNRVSDRGAFLDATVDRIGEIAVLAGLAVSQRTDARILLLCLLALGGALLIPYMRSKAESLGLDGRGGLMGRAERVILVTLGIVVGQVEPMLWVFVIGAWFTAGQRFWATYHRIET
jgi:CDP-diacylglycerol--glycerol-3-phosphate 3-phosphatidyltransferase